jgi:ribosomal protein S18 acetylase RimI-like enzyme
MQLTVRPADPENDLEQLAAFLSCAQRRRVTVERLQELLKLPVTVLRIAVGVDDAGKILGYSLVSRYGSRPPGQFSLWIIVHPDFRRRRIGSELYEHAYRFGRAHGMRELVGDVADDDEAGKEFARSLGFEVERHTIRAYLDLETFPEGAFVPILDSVKAARIEFVTLADMGDTLQGRRRVYELNRTLSADIPGRGPFWSFDEYLTLRFDRAWYRADGVTLAMNGEVWVGLNQVGIHAEEGFAFVEMTGVVAEYRGRKIGQTLELMGIRCARRYGVGTLGTSIDSENAPMLAISRKLGYQPNEGSYLVKAVFV